MYKEKTFLGIIPARSGSKGLPHKNIRELLGKPLIAYSIEAALQTGYFDDIIVSTDSENYAEIARRHGAEVPFLRPIELASDTTLASEYIVHTLETLASLGRKYDYFALLQPTSPLRTAEHIKEGIKKAVDENLTGVVAFSKVSKPLELCHKLPADFSLANIAIEGNRQDFQQYYHINGMLYISDCENFLATRSWYGANSRAIVIDSRFAVDVDSLLDFELAEFFMKRGGEFMIIYSMEHFAGMSPILTLRLTKHRNEKAILIVCLGENTIREKSAFFARLKKTGLFDDVILLKEVSLMSSEDNITEVAAPFASVQELLGKIVATYTPIMADHNLNLADATTIYAIDDITSDFMGFLSYLNIPYVYTEIVPMQIGVKYERSRQSNTPRYRLRQKECAVNANGKPLKKILIFQETTFFDEIELTEKERQMITVFDFTKNFVLIPEEDRLKFLSCFDLDMEFLQNNELAIVLPNSNLVVGNIARDHRVNFSDILYSTDKFGLVYATLTDYFANKNYSILYHPHPNRVKEIKHSDILRERGAAHLDTNMPCEFLMWIPNIKIRQVISLQTTATQVLAIVIEDNIKLEHTFIRVFNVVDRLYIIQNIISRLPHSTVKFYGIPNTTFETLYRCNFADYSARVFETLEVANPTTSTKTATEVYEETEEPKILANTTLQQDDICVINTTLLFDEPVIRRQLILDMLENADENAVVFFTNIFCEYSFADIRMQYRVLLDFIVPIIIHRTKLDDGEPVGELGTITIYAFCKNEETRNQLKATNITKNLHYLNTILTITPLSDEDNQTEYQKCWENSIKNAVAQHLINVSQKGKDKSLKEELAEEKRIMQEEMAAMQQQLYQANYQLQQEKTAHQATKTELETVQAKQKKKLFGKFASR
ncbi:MAG: acylneuraminate cytidylyltransferase family protein [Defluviitaleaceae bacterium]|nr:acylneuraminate cytidylyltransferase family protein [Defluviitaleaceae bacterium]